MPPGQIRGSDNVAASGSVRSLNAGGRWRLLAAVGGWLLLRVGQVLGKGPSLWDRFCLPLGGDHLSCSTPGLFRQFLAVVTGSVVSLVVSVFFLSAEGSF